MTQDALESRRESLNELEKSEQEAKRLEQALERGRAHTLAASAPASISTSPTSPFPPDDIGIITDQGEEEHEQDDSPGSVFLPPHPGPSPVRRRAPGMGLLSALSYTIHGMMDTDPESARRSGISKTRETISQVVVHFVHVMING
jgi:hypothetical protein